MNDLIGRSIVSIDDLSEKEILSIFERADWIQENKSSYFGSARGKILASLFYEPSTRTLFSFETAMQRLDGGVISASDMNTTSASKGESLADTVRVVGGYSDVIVLRHPWEGSAALAAEYSPVPVINAGDGAHEHPTQTLCDLYTLKKHYGTLEGLTVALCGDLRYGRTIHSLAFALAKFRANVVFVPGDETRDVPQYILNRLKRDYGAHIVTGRLGVLSALFGHSPSNRKWDNVNAIYMTPTKPHQLAFSPEEGTSVHLLEGGESISIYVTRRQKEREADLAEPMEYPRVTAETLKTAEFKNISILHPLPRVDEIAPEVDNDPRSLYFRQASYGMPLRMALLWYVLGLQNEAQVIDTQKYHRSVSGSIYSHGGVACSNQQCVSNLDPNFAHAQFEKPNITPEKPMLRCLYCDHETAPGRRSKHRIASVLST